MNKVQKGNYYKRKTKDWFIKQGYEVKNIETSYRIFDKETDKIIFVKKDLWGGDLCACNGKEMIWIQNKTNKVDINKGLKELEKTPLPPFVKKVVVLWEPKAHEPNIYEVKND